ncbi:hypothetical protein EVA_22238 [gut metagenome]|uniref:Uncharacterized protein n=1 Tax=gut metagenome TaxID=749906 RepID=J9F563_9ZZZZ
MIYRTIPSVDIIAAESQKVVTEVATFLLYISYLRRISLIFN